MVPSPSPTISPPPPPENRIDAQLLDRHLNPAARTGLGRLWDGPGTIQLTDVLVPAADGPGEPDVPVRVYRPVEADVLAPVVLFVHGGGFTAGEVEQFDAQCEWYAHSAQAVTVSVGYRLAPQHPYPAALRDVRTVWRWLHDADNDADNDADADGLRRGDVAAELGIDPARSAIVGSSAGAAIAAGLALYLRDHHEPLPALLLLHAPVLDDRHTTPSSHAITDPRTWNRSGSQRSWASYLGPAAAPGADVSPYAAPARASGLAGLPPTFLTSGDLELARDEVLDFASRLTQADVPVELHLYPGATHGFDVVVPEAAISQASRRAQTEALVRALHPAGSAPPR